MQKLMLVAIAAILFASTASSDELSAASLDKRRKALADLLNDQSADLSEAAVKRDLAATKGFLARLERIDTTAFPEQEVIDKALLARNLRENVENIELKNWEMPI